MNIVAQFLVRVIITGSNLSSMCHRMRTFTLCQAPSSVRLTDSSCVTVTFSQLLFHWNKIPVPSSHSLLFIAGVADLCVAEDSDTSWDPEELDSFIGKEPQFSVSSRPVLSCGCECHLVSCGCSIPPVSPAILVYLLAHSTLIAGFGICRLRYLHGCGS